MIIFAPNVGAPDLRQLFTKPQAWGTVRQEIGAYKFYSHHVLTDNAGGDLVGPNSYPALRDVDAFRKVRDWGLQTYVETGVVKEWDCSGTQLLARAHWILDRVEEAGGRVDVLSLDEPLTSGIKGVYDRPTCYDIHHVHTVAEITATFIEAMHGRGVRCELIDAYPQHPVDRHIPFLHHVITILDRRGVHRPVAFQLDYDLFGVRDQKLSLQQVRKDLDQLQAACRGWRIPFGIIVNASRVSTEQDYLREARVFAGTVPSILGGWPELVTVQSWLDTERHSLPGALSHAELLATIAARRAGMKSTRS